MSNFVRRFSPMGAAALVCALGAASADSAQAATKVGWLWASQPTDTSPYAADPSYSYNSASGAITISRLGMGYYKVNFAGLGVNALASNVQVSAYGTNGYCASAGWGSKGAGNGALMWVTCFDPNGNLADAKFTLLYQSYTSPIGNGERGRALVYDGAPSSIFTPTSYTYNSTGGTNSIVHNGNGNYTIVMPGLVGNGGHVQVTALVDYGSPSTPGARCKVYGWSTDLAGTTAAIQCFNKAGAYSDEQFSFAYTLGESLAGNGTATKLDAYEWANNPVATKRYDPDKTYEFNSFRTGRLTSIMGSTGVYTTTIPNSPGFSTSNVLVTAFGNDNAYCNTGFWGNTTIDVQCYAQGGSPALSVFDMNFQASQ